MQSVTTGATWGPNRKQIMSERLKLIAGPCVIEDRETCFEVAQTAKEICEKLNIEYIFKASWKKANRTKLTGFRGIDFDEAMRIFHDVGSHLELQVLTDVHETIDCPKVAPFVDILQIPAFLCRQTDLLVAAGKTGKTINIKKGQFVSPEAMQFAVEKVKSTGNEKVWLTERGACFGYNSLVVDMTSIPKMKRHGVPVIMDATHSVQQPNQPAGETAGNREWIETICLSALAAGANGLFIETHPNPTEAKSDAACMLPLPGLEELLKKCLKVFEAIEG